ncbi:MAG TPA: hypothetical protein VGK64_08305 [Bryobacteraceae bacterium]
MKRLLCALWLGAGLLQAQTSPLTFYIHDTSGATPDTPLSSSYAFANTPAGSSTSIVIRAVNSSANTIYWVNAFVAESASSFVVNSNFSITGQFVNTPLAPSGSLLFTINFAPTTRGSTTGYLRATYQIQQGSCSFTSGTNPCPSSTATASTLTGAGTDPQLVLSYQPASGSPVILQPSSSTPFDFGDVSTSSSAIVTFILANRTSGALPTPTIKLQTTQFFASAFRLDTSALPSSIAGNSSATFTVTFAPGQLGVTDPSTALIVGALTYPLKGTGIVVADIDALDISYTDVTSGSPSFGKITRPQAATAIQFDQLVAGGATSSVLSFEVANPASSYNAVAVSPLRVSGAGFGISGAPTEPISIAPGKSIKFTLTFAAAASGTYTGSLSIGTRQFVLQGLTVISPFPSFSLQLSAQPLTSQQQANLSIQFSAPAAIAGIGTLTMKFTPSVANVADDPAIAFLATNGRQLSIDLAAGSQTATYKGQSAIGFQTGTTAGTLTFTMEFVNTAPYSQSFTISPATVHITSATAVRQNPNLVVTINGYDNTYSTGQLSFTFYDLTGKVIAPITVNAATSFQQYFFTNNTAGGAFALQASFPVQGDVTQVGSVAIGLTNSLGPTNTTQTFQ